MDKSSLSHSYNTIKKDIPDDINYYHDDVSK